MSLSLCTIVKNDELLIKKMLDSAVGVADEIIVADTGSTDRTVEVMEAFQKEHPGLLKILHFEWINDFSAARNFTFEHATSDWILVIDADEFLDPEEKRGLVPFLEKTKCDGVFVKVRNYTGSLTDLTTVVDMDACRVFKRGYKYEGDVHEQIADTISRNGKKCEYYPLHIHHVGYASEYIALKGKTARNTELLEKQLQNMDKTEKRIVWFTRMNLMTEYARMHRWEECRIESEKIIAEMKRLNQKKRPQFMLRVYKLQIFAFRNLNRHHDAIRACDEALRYYPGFTDLHMEKAMSYLSLQDYRSMIDELKTCRQLGDVKFNIVEYLEGNGTYHASRMMGNAWLTLGDDLSARDWFAKSYMENTEQGGVLPWIVMLTPDKQVLEATEKTIRTPQRYEEFIEFYAFLGFADAIEYIEKAEAKWGTSKVYKRARFSHAVRNGSTPILPEEATEEDYAGLALWHYEQGDKEKANELWGKAGVLGEYYIQIQNPALKWELKNVLYDIWAAKAVNFLRDNASRIADLGPHFKAILHSDLLGAFTEEDFLSAFHDSLEAWEWKTQVYLAKGNLAEAERCLDKAYLPTGVRTVRGSIIAGDVYKQDQADILRAARKLYPESQMLSHIWLNYFAPSMQPQGVLM